MHNLLRHGLPNTRPWRLHCLLAPVHEAEIIPDIEIPRLESQLQLMRVPTQYLLEPQMRETSVLVGVVWRKERAGEIGMPAEALHLISARLHGDGRIDCGLVQRLAVEARHSAHGHGDTAQVLIGIGGFLLQRLQGGEGRGPGVQACAFETVKAHDLDGVVVESVIDVGKKDLCGIVVWQANFACSVVVVGRDVESRVGATYGMMEDGGKEAFKHFGVDIVDVIAFVVEIGLWKVNNLDDTYTEGINGPSPQSI